MSDTVGYVVIELNQAGGSPRIPSDIFDTREDAEDVMEQHREETAKVGRRERYAIGTIYIEED